MCTVWSVRSSCITSGSSKDYVCHSSIDNQLDLQSSAQRQWWLRTRLITTVLVNMGNIMERADEQILPALYAFVAASFHIGPTQLGYLTLSRALIQALASPLGGILGGPRALQFQPNDTLFAAGICVACSPFLSVSMPFSTHHLM